MEKKQYSKLISSIPEPDISISMGCDVGCPFIGRAFDDNWKLEDPTGKMKFKEQSFTMFAYTNYRTIQGFHRLEPLDFKGKGAFHHSLVQ